jgi:choline kinase/phosphohistidine swiveling domain-containing protein
MSRGAGDHTTVAHRVVDHRVVILGAGRDVRAPVPPALVRVRTRTGDAAWAGARVLDWILAAFAPLPDPAVTFVGGYMAERVMAHYPDLHVVINAAWDQTGPTASLARAPLDAARATWVTYSDIVFRPECVARLDAAPADVVLAVDSAWLTRYEARSPHDVAAAEKVRLAGTRLLDVGADIAPDRADAEFLGLVRFAPRALAAVRNLLARAPVPNTLPELLRRLAADGLNVDAVDVAGDWAELNAPQDLARFVLGTKAESLERLKPLLRSARIADLVAVRHEAWRSAPDTILAAIRRNLHEATSLIVRSSARGEDSWVTSHAGAFRSVPNVPAGDPALVARAIDDVLASYGTATPDDQVLVQPMLTDVALAGVVMTRAPGSGAPYYVLSFDETSARTDTVTAGTTDACRTVHLLRDQPLRPGLPPALDAVLAAVREVEALVGHDSLDVEFAVGRDGAVWILQVRPMTRPMTQLPRPLPVDDGALRAGLERAAGLLQARHRAHPWLAGERSLYSVMTDWNPAEMIGTTPSRLALSLYRWLVTDEVWAASRAALGYRDVRPCELLVDVLGHPYVDVRADFNSFVPVALPDRLAARLVDHWLDRLAARPELHDKVEFEVLHTCLGPGFPAHAVGLAAAGFAAGEIAALREALRAITRDVVARCRGDLAGLGRLGARYDTIVRAEMPPLERAFLLLDDARRLGYPLFANLARAGFVAVSLLRELEAVEAIGPDDGARLLASLDTVASQLRRDGAATARGELGWEALVERYGHLRPGTYDLTSPCYASDAATFLGPFVRAAEAPAPRADAWDDATRRRAGRALAAVGLDGDGASAEAFIRTAIAGREYGKFVVTRNVSAALEALGAHAESLGVERAAATHVRIGDWLALREEVASEPAARFEALVREGREADALTRAVALPAQLFDPDDLWCFEVARAEPTYVTRRRVSAPVCVLDGSGAGRQPLGGRIVVVPSADPGFDWILSRRIAGLVTMYGGTNSHMAIRAQELGLPAAIGVGSLLYERLAAAELIELDCGARRIRVVR